jgi:hypothetical protein
VCNPKNCSVRHGSSFSPQHGRSPRRFVSSRCLLVSEIPATVAPARSAAPRLQPTRVIDELMPKVSSIGGAASSTLGEPLLVPAAAAPLRAKRLELLDNAKAVLISSVVLYHSAVVYSSADRPEVRMRSSLATLLTGFPMRALALLLTHTARLPSACSMQSPSSPACSR